MPDRTGIQISSLILIGHLAYRLVLTWPALVRLRRWSGGQFK